MRRGPQVWWRVAAVAVPALVYLGIVAVRYDGLPFLRGDCQYYFYTAVSLLEDGDLDLANQLPPPLERHSDDVSLDVHGRLVPKHPVWMAVFALPLIGVLGPQGALVFNLAQLALILLLAFHLARRLASAAAASLAVALTGLASFLPHYVWNFSPDLFSCLLLVAGLVVLPEARSPHRLRHVVAGVLLGLAVVSKFPLVLALPAVPLLCGRPLRTSLPALALGLAVPAALLLALNAHLFGSPLTTSYDRMARIEGEWIVVHSQRSDFGRPLLDGARDQVLDRAHGLLATSPITLLSLLGFYPLFRRSPSTALYLGCTFLSVFLLFATYQYWNASHHGNRFLMPVVVLAALPLASLLDVTLLRRHRPQEHSAEVSPPTTRPRREP